MKKISLAVAAALLSSAAVQASGTDNFTGFHGSLAGSWAGVKTTDTDGKSWTFKDKASTEDTKGTKAVIDNSLFSADGSFAGRLNVGYTKVMANNILVGANVFGAYNMEKITGVKNAPDVDMTKKLSEGEVLAGGMGAGLSLNLGMVVMPKLAIRLIGDVSYDNYKLTVATGSNGFVKAGDASVWALGFAGGAALDFAATDRLLISVGGKYSFAPSDIKFATADNKDIISSDRSFKREGSWNLFAEIGFRITQN